MMKLKMFSLLAIALLPVSMLAQPATTATVHGHVNNQAGMLIPDAVVKFTTDKTGEAKDRKYKYTFPTDKNGDYKGADVAPGDYLVVVFAGAVSADFQEVTIKPGEDKLISFDMTRKEFIDKLSPEDKAALEEYKKKAGAAMSANKIAAQLNATMGRVRADLTAAAVAKDDVSKDVSDMKDSVGLKADEAVLWLLYGDTLQAQGDHLAKLDRADHKPIMSDEAVLKSYSDAVDQYKKAIEVNLASKKPDALTQATGYNQIGNAEAKAGKIDEASKAFEKAAELQPANAQMYYGNEAAVLFNASNSGAPTMDAAGAAADKAIAAGPNTPKAADAYYIKGQALIAHATVDKNGKYVTPPGCIEAYQKFLELAPDSARAGEVRAILQGMGETVNMKYKAPGKK